MVRVKVATGLLIVLVLLLSTVMIKAGRPEPDFLHGSLASSQQKGGGEAEHAEAVEESCEGVEEEEECLMRRTLAAHTDYIYTQKHKP